MSKHNRKRRANTTKRVTGLVESTSNVKPVRRGQVAMLTHNPNTQPTYTDHTFEKYVSQGYTRNELIFACIDRTAKTAAQVKPKVYRKRDNEHLPTHPLQLLLERPNPLM